MCLIYERNTKIEYLTFYILRNTKRRYKWKRDISTVLHSFCSDNSTPPSCIFLAEGQKNINRRGLKLPTIDLNIYNFSDRIFNIIHQISICYIKKTKKLKIDPRHWKLKCKIVYRVLILKLALVLFQYYWFQWHQRTYCLSIIFVQLSYQQLTQYMGQAAGQSAKSFVLWLYYHN